MATCTECWKNETMVKGKRETHIGITAKLMLLVIPAGVSWANLNRKRNALAVKDLILLRPHRQKRHKNNIFNSNYQPKITLSLIP